ncbi:MAG: hypothetical protein GX119_03210 [Syntrophomonadaceae bacterium]|jgi:hypothetical protein|nr:hypothetical protein [Syntrophomonadaceae bacterium]
MLLYLVDLLLIGLIIVLSMRYLMQRQIDIEIKKLYKDTEHGDEQVIKEEDLQVLPPVLQKWLRSSGVVGKERVQKAKIKQKGQLRISPEAAWKPFSAEQYVNYAEPAFIWQAKIKMAPFVLTYGLDKYLDGQGNMTIKLMSVFTLTNASGSEINQGSLLRYLAEIMWQPSAALRDYIQWEEIDEGSARAVISYRGVTTGGVFGFDQEGRPVSFTAFRYRENQGRYTLDEWHVQVSDYKEFQNISLPARGKISWMLPEGEFQWMQLEINELI